MAKYTVLDMTQNILSAMSSDEVNSISDTTESLQVAQILKNKFNDIITRSHLPEHNELFQLDSSGDILSPVLMYVPDNVSKIEWIKYFNSNVNTDSSGGGHDINVDIDSENDDTPNAPPGYQYVIILPFTQFFEYISSFNPEDDTVDTFTFSDSYNTLTKNFTFNFKNNTQPTYATTIGNKYVIFDSFDATQDSTLQSSKTIVQGTIVPRFLLEDNFIPALEDDVFPLLINEAKALAFYELKQQPHVKAEQEIKRQWSSLQRNKNKDGVPTAFDALPNFGRRGHGWLSVNTKTTRNPSGL